jgi:tetrahydromethanopterin S-methyltransferase subunit F
MRDIKRMSGGAAIIQLVKSMTNTANTAELKDIVDDIKDDIQDIGAIAIKIDAKVQDLEAVSGKDAIRIKTELAELKKEETKETAEGKINLEDLKKKMKAFSVASNKKAKAVKARIDAIMPSLKKSSPAELRNVCDTLVNEVIAANNEKLAQMDNIEKILEPVRDNVQIGAVKMLANIAKMREDDKKSIAKILELQKEMESELKGGINIVGGRINTRVVNEAFGTENSMITKLWNLITTVIGVAVSYLAGLTGLNILGSALAIIGPTLIKGIQSVVDMYHARTTDAMGHRVIVGTFRLFREHPYYTEAAAIIIGLGLMYKFSSGIKNDD